MSQIPSQEPSIASQIGRRQFLGRTGAVFGAAASLPLLACDDLPSGPDPEADPFVNPDELFRAGRLDEADLGYQMMIDANPDYAHAHAQRGYIALLSNRFEDAEAFLTRAVELAPGDAESKWRLADAFVRQDKFDRAFPLIRETAQGPVAAQREAIATQYEALATTGQPYDMHGPAVTSVPWLMVDPWPVTELSVNGSPVPIAVDTGAAAISLNQDAAAALGVREVASYGANPDDPSQLTISLGILDSLRLGDIELRNVPVMVVPPVFAPPPVENGPTPVGAIGTVMLYHFLATMDFVSEELVLRRKTDEQLQAFLSEAQSTGTVESTSFWLAPTHFLYSRGSLNGHGMMCTLDTGGGEGAGVSTSEHTALLVGAHIDYDRPDQRGAFPIVVDDVALGPVTRHNIPGRATPGQTPPRGGRAGFEAPATITHEFYKQLAVTFDFNDTTLYIRR